MWHDVHKDCLLTVDGELFLQRQGLCVVTVNQSEGYNGYVARQ